MLAAVPLAEQDSPDGILGDVPVRGPGGLVDDEVFGHGCVPPPTAARKYFSTAAIASA